MNMIMGVALGFALALILVSGPSAVESEADAVKAACEASLPRDEHCVLTYVPAGRLP